MILVRKNGSANPLEQFAWHAYYIDAPLVRFYDDNTDGAGIVEHYYGHDAQFNVTVVHDVSANVVERYTYTPYGELVIMNASWSTISSSAIANAYTYTGREYDTETGLLNFRNRYFHAQLGRFVNRDPIGYGQIPDTQLLKTSAWYEPSLSGSHASVGRRARNGRGEAYARRQSAS